MKTQWYLLAGVLFTIVVAIFAVLNVAPVEVNYLFGTAEWPLVLVILFSTLMGIVIAGSIGIYQVVKVKRQMQQKHKGVSGEQAGVEPVVEDKDKNTVETVGERRRSR
ncbi:lipopolysaccharide assembly LapA domain-containing protein [Sutcliffiella horikoshii]|uniref:LapA family protein n=1 Tax=Sutcliffiella horikoshii TaxID=79883 RepID=UPI001CBC9E12|nr:lipopolysaccharide assembly protein LapA domain-containing protein [Sutcliffiella horikoshii]UAL46298.1 lipopolysaccharide assembly protein LapA domain-containing protein [Sutcliffiella horikoshii]